MKKRNLDGTIGNKIEISGDIERDFIIRVGVTVTFAEGVTFKGQSIKMGQSLYNDDYIPKQFSISASGTLSLISAEEIFTEVRAEELFKKVRAEAEKEAIAQIKAEAEQEAIAEIEAEEALIAQIKVEAIAEVTLKKEIEALEKELFEEGHSASESSLSFPSEPSGSLKRSTAECNPFHKAYKPLIFERSVSPSPEELEDLLESIRCDLALKILEKNQYNASRSKSELPILPEKQPYSLVEILREGPPKTEGEAGETSEMGAASNSEDGVVSCGCGWW